MGVEPDERFFKHSMRTRLPNSFCKSLEIDDLNCIRDEKRQKVTEKKGRQSSETFEVQDKVRIQDHKSGRWTIRGNVAEIREWKYLTKAQKSYQT